MLWKIMETRFCCGSSRKPCFVMRVHEISALLRKLTTRRVWCQSSGYPALLCRSSWTKPDSIVGANRNQALLRELIETRLCCGSSWKDGSGLGAQGNPLYRELMETCGKHRKIKKKHSCISPPILLSSVADPDPHPPEPHVFGPPGSDPDPLVRGMDPDPSRGESVWLAIIDNLHPKIQNNISWNSTINVPSKPPLFYQQPPPPSSPLPTSLPTCQNQLTSEKGG